MSNLYWKPGLIRRYDRQGPRYTSYPTAVEFHEDLAQIDWPGAAAKSRQNGKPLSLYLHIPFCAHLCYYCGCNKVVTKKRDRTRSYLDALKTEIQLQSRRYGRDRIVEQLHWGGGTPTFLSPAEMQELMDWTRSHFNVLEGEALDCSIEVDPREMQDGRLEKLHQLGFNRISIGVQDTDPKVQKAVNRIQSPEMTEQLISEARDLGFTSVSIDLIYGLPHQSSQSFARTLDEILQWKPDRISLFNYAHLPDRFAPQRRIREEDIPKPDEKLKMLENSISELVEHGYDFIGMDHFALHDNSLAEASRNGELHRNFQGYTTHANCDLIGLGVSSISMLEDCYFQNTPDISEYEAALSEERIPVKRGLRLDIDDEIRRDIILELICRFELSPEAINQRWGINFDEYFPEEIALLQQMVKDGLVHQQIDGRYRVMPPGRLLIRVICQVFDRYRKPSATRQFSRII